ncbi:MAG: hypothetical protein N2490_03925 [Ignavibacteria bacterium]|nr:hypothetical protein [Ignavibacteria bacterium]
MNSQTFSSAKKFIIIGIFSTAMGFLESIVVIYLRKIYYPEGFNFPLKVLSPEIISIEWIREIATIIMLLMIGILAGRNNLEKTMYFLFAFGVWDIMYYLGLKLLINWPESLVTWDILFLIPITWLGPVLAPIICSITMIFMAVSLIYFTEKGYKIKINFINWLFIIIGAFLIFITFIWDYSKIILENNFLGDFFNLLTNEKFIKIITEYIPKYFNWVLFIIGETIIIVTTIYIIKKKVIKS